MLKRILSTIIIGVVGTTMALAQGGSLKAKLIDGTTGETLPFAGVVVEQKGTQMGSSTTNLDGECIVKPLSPGKYTVKAILVGYQTSQINDVVINDGKTTYLDIKLSSKVTELQVVNIVDYKEDLVDKSTTVGGTVTREEFQRMATKDVNSVASQTAGVFQRDEGSSISVRGSRPSNAGGGDRNLSEGDTKYFIDGARIIGSAGIPQGGLEQVSVKTGGIAAEWGDMNGGVVNMITRSAEPRYTGGVELITSQVTDAYDYNFAGFNVGGPLVSKKDTATGTEKSIVRFFLAGQVTTEKDPSPSAVGFWKVKDDVLADLEQNPLRPSVNGAALRSAEFIHKDDLEFIKARQNVRSNNYRFLGKVDITPNKNLTITLGGTFDKGDRHDFVYDYALFNPSNNPYSSDRTWRTWVKINQRFGNDDASKEEKSASIFKNAFYTIQANYTSVYGVTQDDNHKANLFNYGYVGRFDRYFARSFDNNYSKDSLTGQTGILQNGFNDTLVTFTPDTLINPLGARYAAQVMEFAKAKGVKYTSLEEIQQDGGLLNGGRPDNIYDLWFNTGRQYNGYQLRDRQQFVVNTSFSADIKNHQVKVGFEYEQRVERGYDINPIGLWSLMRQLANNHIKLVDKQSAMPLYDANGVFMDTVLYERLVQTDIQKEFDKNLRAKLGASDRDFINTDALSPETYSLDMFSADDLLNNGSSLVSYYGYDYLGNKLKRNPSFEDFWTRQDDKGNYTRDNAAFRPIYIAGYVQDAFDFKDIKFNIGLRVDRYDANQKVLKDRYVFYDTKKAGEVTEIGGNAVSHPSNIGSDYVVYVDDINNPSKVVGYRNGDKWYDATGTETANPNSIARATNTGQIQPYLVNPSDDIRSKEFNPSSAFVDFTPQVNFMPRIAFSFPISDVANFFAHYDVLTQRPSTANRMRVTDYYYYNNGGFFNNPDLKPERTNDYELGFSQVLNESKNSAITLAAYYREIKDKIQVIRVTQAYPQAYNTFGNIDFGTVKGFSASYDLRRTKNVSLNVNYTLQFADGTGSGATSAANLVNSDVPNLRTIIPLDYDQRHNIVINTDYRFEGEYNGPRWGGIDWFKNAGANLTFRAGSGTPYTAQSNVTIGDAGSGNISISSSQKSNIKGSPNGSRLPFQYRMDLRLEKTYTMAIGKKEGEDKKKININGYVQVLNLLNSKNINSVYRYTGVPNDDGYLASAGAQNFINAQNDPLAFYDLYQVKVTDPSNYSLPRRIRLGVQIDF